MFFEVVFPFICALFISFLITAAFTDGIGDCFLTRLIAGCSFGGSLVILVAGIIMMFL